MPNDAKPVPHFFGNFKPAVFLLFRAAIHKGGGLSDVGEESEKKSATFAGISLCIQWRPVGLPASAGRSGAESGDRSARILCVLQAA